MLTFLSDHPWRMELKQVTELELGTQAIDRFRRLRYHSIMLIALSQSTWEILEILGAISFTGIVGTLIVAALSGGFK